MEEDLKNLNEIIALCKEDIENDDDNISAVLDFVDLKSLKNVVEYVESILKDKEEKNESK